MLNDGEEFYGIVLTAEEQREVRARATVLEDGHRSHVRIGRRLFGQFTEEEGFEMVLGRLHLDELAPKRYLSIAELDALSSGELSEDAGRALIARMQSLTGRRFRELQSQSLLIEMAARRMYRRRITTAPTPHDGFFTSLANWLRRIWRRRSTKGLP